MGRTCVAAADENQNTCTVKYEMSCSDNGGDTYDAICECSTDAPLTPVPLVYPPPPPARRGDNQCASEPCLGGNAGCNGNLCLGDGDCDADADCVAGLLCGVDNCAAFRNSDGWCTSPAPCDLAFISPRVSVAHPLALGAAGRWTTGAAC